jgi:hypothetical protein
MSRGFLHTWQQFNMTAVALPVLTVLLNSCCCVQFSTALWSLCSLQSLSTCKYACMLLTAALPRRCCFAAVCSGSPNGPCAGTGKCQCCATVQGASCRAANMLNFPSSLSASRIGNGGGCAENKCNAVAAKMGLSAACCPYPCG